MRTFVADIIPKIQRFSKRLDDLTMLTNQHWVLIDDIINVKTVYLFEASGDLDIYENGIEIDCGSWKLTENNSLKLKLKSGGLLLKHGFFDEHVIALKLDSSERYAFFANESRYHTELNTAEDIIRFLENKYLKNNGRAGGLGSSPKKPNFDNVKYGYDILSEQEKFNFPWGNIIAYLIKFNNGLNDYVYKGLSSNEFFYFNYDLSKKIYFKTFDEACQNLYYYLMEKKR